MASDAGGVPSIPWHHTPAPWGTVSCSTGCVMTQILTIAWSPGRTCVSGPCLTYPPSTVETTQQSIKHIHHQLWKQHNSQSKYPPSTVETTQLSIKHIHHQLLKQHSTKVSQAFSSIMHFCLLSVKLTLPQNNSNNFCL